MSDATELVAAQWYIHLETECPKCKHDFDILRTNHDIFHDMEPLVREEIQDVVCPKCKHEFNVKAEY